MSMKLDKDQTARYAGTKVFEIDVSGHTHRLFACTYNGRAILHFEGEGAWSVTATELRKLAARAAKKGKQ
jgi:hypothetical protein